MLKSLRHNRPIMNPHKPILIVGPTASGKSSLALELAQSQNGVIINADALQVYGLWRILTARPSPEDLALAPHRLYGHIPPDQSYSVGAWLRDMKSELEHARTAGQRPIIIGGTGLYMSALTQGLSDIPPIPDAIRAEGNALREKGADGFASLAKDDPITWARIDQRNPARLQRAWEVLRATGRSLAEWQDETSEPLLLLEQTCPIRLDVDRDWLTARIERRFDAMLKAGALDECKEWISRDLPMSLPAAKALGAPELIAHLNGEISLDDARERATITTRQFAKRQRTWLRSRMSDWIGIKLGPEASADNTITAVLSHI